MKLNWKIWATIAATLLIIATLFWSFRSDLSAIFTQQNALKQLELELQVPLSRTVAARNAFSQEVTSYISKNKNYNLRPIYENYIDKIGANGMIDSITRLDPLCHYEGHDLGKVIFSRIGTIGESLAVCQEACYSGCMHGVFMEAFKAKQQEAIKKGKVLVSSDPNDEAHISLDVVKESIPSICTDNSVASRYGLGDCAHGVGHAIMYLSDYQVKPALDTCELFTDKRLAFYCAGGAYMEYVTVKGQADSNDKTKSQIYPCDTDMYPAACFFSKIGDMLYTNQVRGGKVSAVINTCLSLTGFKRLGCFHGFGNGFLTPIVQGSVQLKNVCSSGTATDQQVCIEGAMMRMGKYHFEIGKKLCTANYPVADKRREICLNALNQKMYGLDRPFELYYKK